MSRPEIERLRKVAVFHYDVGDAVSYRRASARNRRFHEAVAAASHNHQVVNLIAQCLSQMERFMALGVNHGQFQNGAGVEHGAVVDAIEARDPVVARSAMAAHLEHSGELLMRWAMGGDARGLEMTGKEVFARGF